MSTWQVGQGQAADSSRSRVLFVCFKILSYVFILAIQIIEEGVYFHLLKADTHDLCCNLFHHALRIVKA